MAEHDLHKVAFPKLDDVQVTTLAQFSTQRILRDGEHLFNAGDREYKFFVVERGAVEIVEHSSGETKRVALHERHAFGGDVSLVTGRPALISAILRGDTARTARVIGLSRTSGIRGWLFARHLPHS